MEGALNGLIPSTGRTCTITTGNGAPSGGAVAGETGLRRKIHADWPMPIR